MSEPLRPRVFAILLALAEGPRHGYGLMQSLQADPTEQWLLGPATLYRTLKEMQTEGLITSTEGPDQESGGPPRRYYRLTATGHRAGAAEAARMATLARRWESVETA
ncbi:MAG TPA: PadR family transcriptional regulator [Gemmatimonadales bacterium]|nr:PadR family transcriptional regulator [Gemmatimonadales bacterium]